MATLIEFTPYIRVVLPLDGYVFWVRQDLLSQGAIFNALGYNSGTFNAPPKQTPNPAIQPIKVQGSFHFGTEISQEETNTFSSNRVIFSATSPVVDLNKVGPNLIYLATYQGIRFAFARRDLFFQQAGIHHYVGTALYSDMQTQIVDDLVTFNQKEPIVSNSLPIWLAMNGYTPQPWEAFGSPPWTLFPSFLVPSNEPPPFASVNVEATDAIGNAPVFGPTYTHSQLVADRVRVMITGARNQDALDFIDFVGQQSLNQDTFGLSNSPVVYDEHRTQVEILALGMKKSIIFEINYQQSRLNSIARQYIKSVVVDYLFTPGVPDSV